MKKQDVLKSKTVKKYFILIRNYPIPCFLVIFKKCPLQFPLHMHFFRGHFWFFFNDLFLVGVCWFQKQLHICPYIQKKTWLLLRLLVGGGGVKALAECPAKNANFFTHSLTGRQSVAIPCRCLRTVWYTKIAESGGTCLQAI